MKILVILPVTLVLSACSHTASSNLLLEWTDTNSRIRFQVFERPALVKRNVYFRVEEGGAGRERMIDDDVCFGVISFQRHADWLLVGNDQYIVAGYNYKDGRMVGEAEWDQLPFTLRKTSGDIVVSRKVGIRALPAQFPVIEEK